MDIRGQTYAILAKQALVDPASLTDAMTLEALGLDSMALVETIFAIEERFDVCVPFNANQPDETSVDLSTVGAVVAAVQDLVSKAQA